MNNTFIKKSYGINSNNTFVYPHFSNENNYTTNERVSNNLSNMGNITNQSNISYLNKPPIKSREFGKELNHSNSNSNLIGVLNERRNINGSNKLLNYFRPIKNGKDEKSEIKNTLKNENTLYNLRPRLTNNRNNSKTNSNNNSFNSNNENENTINTLNKQNTLNRCNTIKNLTAVIKTNQIKENVIYNEPIAFSKPNAMDVDDIVKISEKPTEKHTFKLLTARPLSITNSLTNHALAINFECKSINNINNFLYQNPQYTHDYLNEIYDHLKATESLLLPKYGYMNNQKDLNEKMRAILIDWLVEVHLKFKLVPETLFLTVQLIDRFLEKKEINRNRLQLVGVTCLFIASKYEEIYPPELNDFVFITDKAYSKSDILGMEYEILNTLDFNITHPSSFRFLEIFIQLSRLEIDEKTFHWASYLLELFLVEYRMIKYQPSWIAAATLYITIRVKKLYSFGRKVDIPRISGYTEENIKECARDICIILDNADKSSLQAVKSKYSSVKFLEVAKK